MSAATRILRLALLLFVLALAVEAYRFYRLEYPNRVGTPSPVTILLAPGAGTAQIFQKLEQAGVVRDARLAEIYYRIYRSRTPLQAGEYRFERPMPIDEVINRMGHGDVLKYSVLVPGGLTAEETFQLFWSRGIGGPEGFHRALAQTELLPGLSSGVSDLEGFLFPETYVVTRSTPAQQIVDRMVEQFRRNFTPQM